jgi:Na+/proline symporter
MAGGAAKVISSAAENGKFQFWPALTAKEVLAFVAAWITMMFGSIPQQDVFQRVMSAKNVNTAVAGSVLGGSLYFVFAFIPMFLAYSASLIDPAMFASLIENDTQQILPTLVLKHTPIFAQVMFFGALLSAIMSTASGTLLAPSATFTENILKPSFKHLGDKQLLTLMRVVVVCFAVIVTAFAMYTTSSIYDMVGSAYKVTLVAAFVPLFCGVYWKRATTQGALLSIFAGLAVWLGSELTNSDGLVPPQLAGFLASIAGMVFGSFMPAMIAKHAKGVGGAHP